jgi:hypothetical protein
VWGDPLVESAVVCARFFPACGHVRGRPRSVTAGLTFACLCVHVGPHVCGFVGGWSTQRRGKNLKEC